MVELAQPGRITVEAELPPDLYHALKQRSDRMGVTVNAIVKGAIRDWLARRNFTKRTGGGDDTIHTAAHRGA